MNIPQEEIEKVAKQALEQPNILDGMNLIITRFYELGVEEGKINTSVLEDIKAEIDEHIEYNTKMNYTGIVSGLALSKNIIDNHINRKEQQGDKE